MFGSIQTRNKINERLSKLYACPVCNFSTFKYKYMPDTFYTITSASSKFDNVSNLECNCLVLLL